MTKKLQKKSRRKEALPTSRAKNAYDLLTEVKELILADPRRYDQGTYIERHGGVKNARVIIEYPPCGTVGCVAGWVATLKRGRRFTYGTAGPIAEDILGLDQIQANDLFSGDAAPYPAQTRDHAKAGARHITAFQKRYREQLKAHRLKPVKKKGAKS
jgi:hypothetical protein